MHPRGVGGNRPEDQGQMGQGPRPLQGLWLLYWTGRAASEGFECSDVA